MFPTSFPPAHSLTHSKPACLSDRFCSFGRIHHAGHHSRGLRVLFLLPRSSAPLLRLNLMGILSKLFSLAHLFMNGAKGTF